MRNLDRFMLGDLTLFLAVARHRSFKAAAIELGVTPSAASHAIKRLEYKLAVKLLNRSSRAVKPTALGQDVMVKVGDGLDAIRLALGGLETPGASQFGELRLNVFADAAHLLVTPALPEFVSQCPGARLTMVVENRPIDIIREGYDAGIRYGHYLPETMVGVALSGPQQWVIAASPAYVRLHGVPNNPPDLLHHPCLQVMLGDNSNYSWELGPKARGIKLRVKGDLTLNDTAATIAAAKAGLGLAYVLKARIAQELQAKSLIILLPDFAAEEDPFYIYYPSRQNLHPALGKLINIIRRRNGLTMLKQWKP